MTLLDVADLFSTDEKCRELLKRLRWPNGVKCIRCNDDVVELETAKELFYCRKCDYQFSVTAGSIFNDSHLPLLKWFVATYLMCESRKGHSANQMKRVLGVSYKTAWYLCHRIRAAMNEVNKAKLTGTVEVDEVYLGGKRRMAERKNKDIVIGIRQRNGELRFIHANDTKSETLYQIIADNVDKSVDVIVTDELPAYNFTTTQFHGKHKRIKHKSGVYVMGDVHTNTVESAFSLLRRGITGTWHKISAKHLPAYLDEMTFRFNRRKAHDLFLDTLRHMITAPVLTFEKLTA